MSPAIKIGVITVSDRAAKGVYQDLGGPVVRDAAKAQGWTIQAEKIVPDDAEAIQQAVREQLGQGCDVILTTGGTGIGPRDVTPEAIRAMATRELPGFGELMRRESARLTPLAILSRSMAAAIEGALVICLPGKPSAAVECLCFVAGAIPHAVEILKELPDANDHSPRGSAPSRKE